MALFFAGERSVAGDGLVGAGCLRGGTRRSRAAAVLSVRMSPLFAGQLSLHGFQDGVSRSHGLAVSAATALFVTAMVASSAVVQAMAENELAICDRKKNILVGRLSWKRPR